MPTEKIILADLGGTRLRLALRGASGPEYISTYTPQDWDSLQDILSDYTDAKDATLLLSFAKKVNADGFYSLDQAHKKGAWSFRTDTVKQACGLKDFQVLHDMHAMGLAIFHPDRSLFEPLVKTRHAFGFNIIINVGTGLGHAYVHPDTRAVYDTFGGHFPPAAVTHEQQEALALLRAGFRENRAFIWEEVLSGRGLEALEEQTMDGARLFCEFLGLYAQTLAIAGHAFGGVYLCGGVMEAIYASHKFNVEAYEDNFVLNHVPIVDADLKSCPLFYAGKAHTALYGLDVYAQSLSYN